MGLGERLRSGSGREAKRVTLLASLPDLYSPT